MITAAQKKALKKQGQQLQATIQIGKKGINQQAIEEMHKQLKKRKLIKIKMLKGFIDTTTKKAAFEEIAKKAQAEVIHKVGFTITLYKK
tara:strand:- start:201 stop:467 length:267 start_codon:yes stop_codon:yes gene_type:complete